MSTNGARGCREYQSLSRREFLGASGIAVAAIGAPAWLPRVAFAQDHCSDRDIIVSIFLRGAADGLSLCVPHGDNDYYTARPTLNIPRPDSGQVGAAIDLDGFFGLPQSLSALKPAFDANQLAIVHACGMTDASRSHFDVQRFMEIGSLDDLQLFTGWLGRHLASVPPLSANPVLRALSVGVALPRTLSGAPLALPVPDPGSVGLVGRSVSQSDRIAFLAEQYAQVADPVGAAAQNTLNAIDLLDQIDFLNYVPAGGASYGNDEFATGLAATAALIKADVGVEAISLDLGGWDTHEMQGSVGGSLSNLMTRFGDALGAFHTDVFTTHSSVTVVVMSEFGRRVDENGSLGTDHGHGNCMFVLGDSINGGKVHGTWPGLAVGQRHELLDLKITTDYRDVLSEIVQNRLANPQLDEVFPGFSAKWPGITTCPTLPEAIEAKS